jgi:hypothetical protein
MLTVSRGRAYTHIQLRGRNAKAPIPDVKEEPTGEPITYGVENTVTITDSDDDETGGDPTWLPDIDEALSHGSQTRDADAEETGSTPGPLPARRINRPRFHDESPAVRADDDDDDAEEDEETGARRGRPQARRYKN